jgi:O-antigen/teichoic acid export membrane protein
MTIAKNVIANFLGKIWTIASVFLFVPLYIKMLGIESYAIVNFYSVILTLLFFADAGLSATLNREMAITNDYKYLGNLLYTIERVYLIICVIIILILSLSSNFIASNWIQSTTISLSDVSYNIRLMSVCIALQLIIILYNSGLMGLQKQVLASTLQVGWSFTRSGLVVVPLYFYPNIYTYFIWQIAINLIFALIIRFKLWQQIQGDSKRYFDPVILRTVLGFAVGMMAMAIISSLNTQIDKLLVSKMLTLQEFGYYSLAGILSQASLIIITPIAMAVLPQMTKHVGSNNYDILKQVFQQYSFLISTLTTIVTSVLLAFTFDFINIWTGNADIATQITTPTRLLLVGGFFLSLQFMPYHLAIANAFTKFNIRLGVVSVLLIIPALILCINLYGLIGATIPWLCMNIIACVLLGYFIINKFIKGEFKNWIILNTLLPALSIFGLTFLIYLITLNFPRGYWVILYSFVIGLCSILLNLKLFNYLNPSSKIQIIQLIKNAGKRD